jgi:hypothetical protein
MMELLLPVVAYIGPGTGLSAIGALIAVVVAVIVTLFGFVWYPVKRLLRKKKPSAGGQLGDAE